MDLVKQTAQYVEHLFDTFLASTLPYHNLDHTKLVVQRTIELIRAHQLPPRAGTLLEIAAWFHDVGFLISGKENHEQIGVEAMKVFFLTKGIAQDEIDQIARCIMATRLPTQPLTLEEALLCDADSYHLGTDNFEEMDLLVREEYRLYDTISDYRWNLKTLHFLRKHRFYTAYCQTNLEEGKKKNIQLVQKRISDAASGLSPLLPIQ